MERREISTSLQYFAIAVAVGLGAFFTTLPDVGQGGELAITINMNEAWQNYWPVMRAWLVGFATLSIIRLLLVYTIHHRRNRS